MNRIRNLPILSLLFYQHRLCHSKADCPCRNHMCALPLSYVALNPHSHSMKIASLLELCGRLANHRSQISVLWPTGCSMAHLWRTGFGEWGVPMDYLADSRPSTSPMAIRKSSAVSPLSSSASSLSSALEVACRRASNTLPRPKDTWMSWPLSWSLSWPQLGCDMQVAMDSISLEDVSPP